MSSKSAEPWGWRVRRPVKIITAPRTPREANVDVEDPGAFTASWNAIQRFRQYEAAVRQAGVARIAQLASAPEGPLTELVCADNPNSFFPGTSALPVPQAVAPDF